MHNPAKSEHPVHTLIQNRWSPRAFSEKPISDEALRSLFEAARWAPSSSNEQPWAFIVATKNEAEESREDTEHAGRVQPVLGQARAADWHRGFGDGVREEPASEPKRFL